MSRTIILTDILLILFLIVLHIPEYGYYQEKTIKVYQLQLTREKWKQPSRNVCSFQTETLPFS